MNAWWQRSYQRMNRILQVVCAIMMLLLALDWARGDGSQRAMLAVLGAVMTVSKLLEQRGCRDEA